MVQPVMALVWPEFAASCQKRAHVYRAGTHGPRVCTPPANWAAKCTRPGTRLPRACTDPRNSAATCTGVSTRGSRVPAPHDQTPPEGRSTESHPPRSGLISSDVVRFGPKPKKTGRPRVARTHGRPIHCLATTPHGGARYGAGRGPASSAPAAAPRRQRRPRPRAARRAHAAGYSSAPFRTESRSSPHARLREYGVSSSGSLQRSSPSSWWYAFCTAGAVPMVAISPMPLPP